MHSLIFVLALVLLSCSIVAAKLPYIADPPNPTSGTALDEYVNRPDPNYGWVELPDHEFSGKGFIHRDQGWTGYTLNMTSQQWLTPEDFSNTSQSNSIWYHIMVIIVPDEVKYQNNGSLYITGWSMPSPDGTGGMPNAKDEDIRVAAALAVSTGIITGCLFQVPDEKITFAADPIQKSRGEDAIVRVRLLYCILLLCCMLGYSSILLLTYSISNGLLLIPDLLISYSIIAISLHNTTILIITPKSTKKQKPTDTDRLYLEPFPRGSHQTRMASSFPYGQSLHACHGCHD